MGKQEFRYSLLWRIAFAATVPLVALLSLIYLGNNSSGLHFSLSLILSILGLTPYFFLILKFSEKYIALDDRFIHKHIFIKRSLMWKDIIEYRDFYNVIVLMPIIIRQTIHIYFYRNIKNYTSLRKYLSDKSREYEVNMMSRKRDRIFLIIDIGAVPVLMIVVIAVITIILFRNHAFLDMNSLLTGLISGTLFVISSVSVWMLLNDLTTIAREYAHIMATIMSITLVGPMLVIAGEPLSEDGLRFASFLFSYLLGYAIGWGGMSAFFPNRETKNMSDSNGKRQTR